MTKNGSKQRLCSIIIRSKNEERWISSCLQSVYNQSYKEFEIIIVDNNSTDKTLEKVRQFPVKKIINITDYLPGKALNLGIRHSKGEYIVCLSGHCIPTTTEWLASLVNALEEDEKYAGVYGRQEPMSFSSMSDKRDMMLVFGLDRKIQSKDSFFHNANSIFRRELWEKIYFNEEITNIEDRIWAQEILNLGYKIMYEPEASVFHYHGIHQSGNHERLRNVIKIIEKHHNNSFGKLDPKNLNIVAIIPIKGISRKIGDKPLLFYTVSAAKKSRYINRIIVSTDNEQTADHAKKAGAECPFIRPSSLSEPFVNLEAVQKYSIEKIEQHGILPDLVVHLEETFPFRPEGLIDNMICYLLEDGYDSVIAARREPGFLWQENNDGKFTRLDSGDVPRKFKESTLIGLHGLGCVSHPEYFRKEHMLGNNIGLYKTDHPLAGFEVRNEESAEVASKLIKSFVD